MHRNLLLSTLAGLAACAAAPESEKTAECSPLSAVFEATADGDRALHIVELRHTQAHMMAQVLQHALSTPAPDSVRIAPEQLTNRLVLVGAPGDLERAAQIVERLDQPAAAEVIVHRLWHANAQELAPRLDNLFSDLEIVAYDRRFLLASGPAESLARAQAIATELDRALSENP